MKSLEVHIEELVLYGFPYGDRYRIAEAVERELGRLFVECGVPLALAGGGQTASLDGGEFETGPGAAVETIGAQVARVVYGGLGR